MADMKFIPIYPALPTETPSAQSLVKTLNLAAHPEGGYYVQTDKSYHHVIPNPFLTSPPRDPFETPSRPPTIDDIPPHLRDNAELDDTTRTASTTIFYLLTPYSPKGHFHRNKARTMH